MEAIVEQCSINKKYFDIQKKELFLDNDLLLEHIIYQDVMNIMRHANFVLVNVLPANNKCLVNDNLEFERLELDFEPLAPRVVKNKDAHIEYIKHTQELADILWELVEHARVLRPLDSDLNSALPPKNPLPTKVAKKTTPRRNNYEMLHDVTNISSSSRSNVVESYISNNSEPSQTWGSNVSTALSSSLINFRFSKLFSGLLCGRAEKLDLSYLHVFGAPCYPINDSKDLGKLKPKADIRIFVSYAPAKKAYRIYNKRTRLIIETIHVDFDELTTTSSKQFSSGPRPQLLTPRTISSGLVPNLPS
ncbi:hypothetical protein Tco_0809500 [Tanacetum coccineum]